MFLELKGRSADPLVALSFLLTLVCAVINSDSDLSNDSHTGLSCYEMGMASPTLS